MASDLICPKCQGAMRTYERNGIQIDQCTECRGIFLDRGELERLMDAEATYSQAPARDRSAAAPARPAQDDQSAGYGWGSGGHHGKPEYGGHQGKRRKGFLGELFD